MNQELKDKIEKIMELINRGATEGEKAAAKKALERIMKKYNIDESQLKNIDKSKCWFIYTSDLEQWLLVRLMKVNGIDAHGCSVKITWRKQIESELTYSDWVTVECSYEYFRRHMKKEWKRLCQPEVNKCRTNKTRNKRRKQLQELFFTQYCIASGLCKQEELQTVEVSDQKELQDRYLIGGVEGGTYNKQVVTNLLLEY